MKGKYSVYRKVKCIQEGKAFYTGRYNVYRKVKLSRKEGLMYTGRGKAV